MEATTTTAILDALPDPVLMVDDGPRSIAANQAAMELLGPQILDRSLALVLRHPEILETVDNVMSGSGRERARITLRGAVPRSFDVQVAGLPSKTADPARVVLVLHDITAAESADRMRADFVANVSHELRSPLSSLVGFIETLQGAAREDAAARDRFLDIMSGEANRMARLIDDLLSLSKVETNEHVAPENRLDIVGLLKEVVNTLANRSRESGVAVELDAAEPLPAVIGDRDELVEVFHNLIDNAVKYGGDDSIVHVVAREVDRIPDLGGPGVLVSVEDQGDGIAAEHLPRLTERFYRADKGRSRSMGGTGLGLAIVKHIVNRHRGRLAIDSTVGEGSVFTVYLRSRANGAEKPSSS